MDTVDAMMDAMDKRRVVAASAIQPAMRGLVDWLNDNGFRTTDSGDGVTNVAAGMEGALPFPHVVIRTEPQYMVREAKRLLSTLEEDHIAVYGVPGRSIEATFSPVDGVATIMLVGITGADVPQRAA